MIEKFKTTLLLTRDEPIIGCSRNQSVDQIYSVTRVSNIELFNENGKKLKINEL